MKARREIFVSAALLAIILVAGLYMRFSMDHNSAARDEFCKSKGFDGARFEDLAQLFYCFKESGEKQYMASYLGEYALFNRTEGCMLPQFQGSKICYLPPP